MLLIATIGQVYATLQLPALMADIINNGIVPGDMSRVWQDGGLMLILVLEIEEHTSELQSRI